METQQNNTSGFGSTIFGRLAYSYVDASFLYLIDCQIKSVQRCASWAQPRTYHQDSHHEQLYASPIAQAASKKSAEICLDFLLQLRFCGAEGCGDSCSCFLILIIHGRFCVKPQALGQVLFPSRETLLGSYSGNTAADLSYVVTEQKLLALEGSLCISGIFCLISSLVWSLITGQTPFCEVSLSCLSVRPTNVYLQQCNFSLMRRSGRHSIADLLSQISDLS